MAPLLNRRQRRGWRRWSALAGGALVDFDGYGRLDLIVSNRRAPLELYRSVTPATGNWISVDLRQKGSNRDAIGAVITVTTDAGVQSVQQVIGGGHAGG